MAEPLVIRVPGAPVPKGRPRFARIGGFVRAYTPAKTAAYETKVKKLGVAELMRQHMGPFDGPITVTIDAKLQIPASWSRKKKDQALAGILFPTGRLDADNIAKAALDALNGAVFKDDGQIVDLTIHKRYGEPEIVITISAVEAPLAKVAA